MAHSIADDRKIINDAESIAKLCLDIKYSVGYVRLFYNITLLSLLSRKLARMIRGKELQCSKCSNLTCEISDALSEASTQLTGIVEKAKGVKIPNFILSDLESTADIIDNTAENMSLACDSELKSLVNDLYARLQ